jgi:hypothetical protein
MLDHGAGLNVLCVNAVAPGLNVDNNNPSKKKLTGLWEDITRKGAIGFKVLGGHFPLTPEATRFCLEIAHNKDSYFAFHVGTTKTKSDIDGFCEAADIVGQHSAHIAHINSYCRGKDNTSLAEAFQAIDVLEKNPNIFSESYLSPMNGTSGKIINGRPASSATAMWLKKFSFSQDYEGMKTAILSKIAGVIVEQGSEMVICRGDEALKHWLNQDTDIFVSFDINPADSRFLLASTKRTNDLLFAVDCISSDGGGFPRNVIIQNGLALVAFGAISMQEFVIKTSRNPANMLGLTTKGSLAIGNDADITIIDKSRHQPSMAVAAGKIIMQSGEISGRSGTALVLQEGLDHVNALGIRSQIIDRSALYRRRVI